MIFIKTYFKQNFLEQKLPCFKTFSPVHQIHKDKQNALLLICQSAYILPLRKSEMGSFTNGALIDCFEKIVIENIFLAELSGKNGPFFETI